MRLTTLEARTIADEVLRLLAAGAIERLPRTKRGNTVEVGYSFDGEDYTELWAAAAEFTSHVPNGCHIEASDPGEHHDWVKVERDGNSVTIIRHPQFRSAWMNARIVEGN